MQANDHRGYSREIGIDGYAVTEPPNQQTTPTLEGRNRCNKASERQTWRFEHRGGEGNKNTYRPSRPVGSLFFASRSEKG